MLHLTIPNPSDTLFIYRKIPRINKIRGKKYVTTLFHSIFNYIIIRRVNTEMKINRKCKTNSAQDVTREQIISQTKFNIFKPEPFFFFFTIQIGRIR